MDRIDDAVVRILAVKYSMGLITEDGVENPVKPKFEIKFTKNSNDEY